VRKRSEGFNYTAAAPAGTHRGQGERPVIPARALPNPAGGRSDGGGSNRRHSFRSSSTGRGRRWRR
jgi:hypothetical protein